MSRPTATVYITDTCPYCTMMVRHLREKDIQVRTVNIQKDQRAAQRLMATTGQLGVPQTQLNGKWILGFDPNGVEQALKG